MAKQETNEANIPSVKKNDMLVWLTIVSHQALLDVADVSKKIANSCDL